MPLQLLNEAIEEARRSPAPVRAMALLHIARVLTAIDHSEAKRMLAQAIKEVDALPAADRDPAMNDIVSLIATVSPEAAFLQLPSLEPDWGQVDWVLRNMLIHGHKAEVIADSQSGSPRNLALYSVLPRSVLSCGKARGTRGGSKAGANSRPRSSSVREN